MGAWLAEVASRAEVFHFGTEVFHLGTKVFHFETVVWRPPYGHDLAQALLIRLASPPAEAMNAA